MMLPLLIACRQPTPEAVCPPPPLTPGEVRVRQLACADDLPTGEFVAARIGDWVLENAYSRWVIRDGPEGHALVGLTGGNIVDAVRVSNGTQQGEDGLREYATMVGFHVLAPNAFVAGPDRLEISGELQPFPLVTDILPVARPTASVRWEYVLEPRAPVLEARVHVDGAEASIDELLLLRGGQQLFIPGADPWALPLSSDAARLGVLTPDPVLGPALATSADAERSLLYAGPIRVVLHKPRQGSTVRRLALGYDHAAASAWLDPQMPLWDNDQGLVEVRNADGAPVSRCRTERCAVPDDAVSLTPVWIGDGNGGLGGADQAGEPARLKISATGPFRATAVRSDGLERTLVDADGEATFLVPAGETTVTVQAGPTFSQHTATVVLISGQEVAIDASDLRQVIDTSGWSAADLHVHQETSLDSDVPSSVRLIGALAERLDYVVTTDHDFVGHPNVPAGLIVRPSAEVSTMDAGHFNAWPVVADPDAAGNGAPDWRGLDVDALVDALPGAVQCNHPRFVDGGYAASFEIGLAPERCDLIEVLNGFSSAETPAVLNDLLTAWSAGHRPVATGTSDCHTDHDRVGSPRTWIYATGDADTLDSALLAGRAVASGGPFITLELASAGSVAQIGDTLAVAGPVTASIDVQAPDWMALGEIALIVDGIEQWTEDLSGLVASGGLKRRQVDVDVSPSAYVLIIHRGPSDAVTNPVWIE